MIVPLSVRTKLLDVEITGFLAAELLTNYLYLWTKVESIDGDEITTT